MNKRKRYIGIGIVLLCFGVAIGYYQQVLAQKSLWNEEQDGDNYIVQTLDMTDAEIDDYEMEQLKDKYTGVFQSHFSGYIYEIEKEGVVYDSKEENHKILVGIAGDSWGPVSERATSDIEQFSTTGSYRTLTEETSMNVLMKAVYETDPQYDSNLGLFVEIRTTEYKIIQKDSKTDEVVSTIKEYIMTTYAKAVYPIGFTDANSYELSYYRNGVWNPAYMLKEGLVTPPTSCDDIMVATTGL